jgi:phenylpropionate dioxygenase-like ring-hydroxylating dioxygenase large terminal subunit
MNNTVNHLVKELFDETTEEITTIQKNINALYRETESHDVQILETITDTINLVFESNHYPKTTEKMMSQRREITELQAGIREVTADLANIWRIIQIPKHMMHLRPNFT